MNIKKYYKWLPLAFAIVPALLIYFFISKYAINTPFFDQWELSKFFIKGESGSLTISDFFAFHNEHRLLFPRLYMFGLAILTGWNVVAEMYSSLFMAVLSFIILFVLIRRALDNFFLTAVVTYISSWFFFSIVQWENWIWGWQLQWFMSILSMLSTLYFIQKVKTFDKFLFFSIISAVIATYSLGSGFLVWFGGLMLLIVSKNLQSKARVIALWATLSTISIILNFIGQPSATVERTLPHEAPIALIKYLFAYIGHPLAPTLQGSIYAGGLILSIFGLLFIFTVWGYREQLHRVMPWIFIGFYVVISGTATGISRLGLGLDQALASRYTTVSILLIIATLVLLALTLLRLKSNYAFGMGILLVVLLLFFGTKNYIYQIGEMQNYRLVIDRSRQCTQSLAQSPNAPCLKDVYIDPATVWNNADYLKGKKWAGY